MSHVATIGFAVTSIEALRRACEKRGLRLEKRQNYHWFGQWVNDYHRTDAAYKQGYDPKEYGKNAEWVVTAKGTKNEKSGMYEVGIVPNKNGPGYVMMYDFYAGGLGMSKLIGGDHAEGLIQDYQMEAVRETEDVKHLLDQGFTESVQVEEATGDVLLIYED
jgi:hypothetical protein